MSEDLKMKKMAIVEGAIRVYKKECSIKEVVNAKEIQQILKAIPQDLKSDEHHMEVDRAIHAAVQRSSSISIPVVRKMYTAMESMTDMFQVVTGQKKLVAAVVPEATLKRYLIQLKTVLGKNEMGKKEYKAWISENSEIVLSAIQSFVFPQSGPSTLLAKVDVDLLASISDLATVSGNGLSTKQIGIRAKELLNSHAEAIESANGGAETKESKRLKTAKCGKHFITSNFCGEKPHLDKILNGETVSAIGRDVKTSSLSLKRMRSLDPTLQSTAARSFMAHDEELIKQGVLPAGGAKPESTFNLDEIGLDPCGRISQRYTLFRTGNERLFTERSGEHAIFWTTLVLIISAAGRLFPPLLIHQGAQMRGDFVNGCPDDWRVVCTESGYLDGEGFKEVANMLVGHMQQAGSTAGVSYLDGYHHHFNADAHQYMFEKGLHNRFLRSQASIADQPLDNGVNAMFKKYYDEAYQMWLMRHPGVPITPAHQNRILAVAWVNLQSDPNLKDVIIRSWAKTHLYPPVDTLAVISSTGGVPQPLSPPPFRAPCTRPFPRPFSPQLAPPPVPTPFLTHFPRPLAPGPAPFLPSFPRPLSFPAPVPRPL